MASIPLRVGVLVDGPTLPRVAHRALLEIAASDVARVVLVVRNGAPPARARRLSLFAAYEALDHRLLRAPNDYSAPVDVAPLLERCDVLVATPERRAGCDVLSGEDVEAIAARGLDVLLQFGFGSLAGPVLGAARLGVFTFAHDEDARRGVPPMAREVIDDVPAVETRLLARTPHGTRTLFRSVASTDRNSLDRTRNPAYWKSSEFVMRALRAAAAGTLPAEADAPESGKPDRAPRAREVVRFAGTRVARILRNRKQLRREACEWFLAIRKEETSRFCCGDLDGFAEIPNAPGRYFTDPFLIRHAERTWLFFEDASIATDLGRIQCMAIDDDGARSEPEMVLERETHLSYPCVFEWGGEHYMIPESAETRSVELHRAVDFPRRWTLEKVLFQDTYAVDATVLEADGRFWMFVAMSVAGGSANDELFLFHADTPHGAWTPHPANPIVSDARRARPAGRIFRENGAWIRPAQDCTGAYGAAMVLHRIDVLTEREYRETPIARIDPVWAPGLVGTHTVATGGGFSVIDGRHWRPRQR